MNLICIFFGHNKFLEIHEEGNQATHVTICSQCKKEWIKIHKTHVAIPTQTKKQVETKQIEIKQVEIKQTIKVRTRARIAKSATNFYLL